MLKRRVVQILRSPIGGIRKHVYDIIEGLPADKFEHIFITNVKEADYQLPEMKNLKIIHMDFEEKPSLKDVQFIFSIYCILYALNVDVIHGHGAKGGLYARIVAYFLRVKCIYTPHGGSLHRVHGKIKNFIYDSIEAALLPFTDVLLFESNYSKNTYYQNILDAGEKGVVNYNGVEIPEPRIHPSYKSGDRLKLASFGLLRHIKGHDIIISACLELKNSQIPFSYAIYGKGEEFSNLKNQIEVSGLNDSVKIFDYCNDVINEMLKYDFIVQPSRFESFGYVPVEAMALKIPVISSSEGGLKEVVTEETGYLSKLNISKEYVDILKGLFEGKLRTKVEKAFETVSKKFNKKNMISKLEELYRL